MYFATCYMTRKWIRMLAANRILLRL